MVVLICLVGLVIAIVCGNNGQWLSLLAVLAIVGLLGLICSEEKKTNRAIRNARDWWAKGGPER